MNKNKFLVLIILYASFVSLGLPDQVLGIAWPDMRLYFKKPLDAAGNLVFMAAVLSAFSSMCSGWLQQRLPVVIILIISTFLTVAGLVGYGLSPSWIWVVFATVPHGLGAGAVDAVLNDYVAKNYSSRHMNWLHGCWGIGASLGPAIMTFFVSGGSWRAGYLIIAALQTLLITIFILTRRKWKNAPQTETPLAENQKPVRIWSAAPILSILFFFFYTGTELSVGLWFYSVLVEADKLLPSAAGILIVIYWSSLTAGRFGMGIISARLGNRRIVRWGLAGAFGGALLLFSSQYILLLSGIVLVGFSLSGIYPSMMHETSRRFDSAFASRLTGFQAAAAALGAAFLAPLIGIVLTYAGLLWFVPMFIFNILILEVILRFLNRLT